MKNSFLFAFLLINFVSFSSQQDLCDPTQIKMTLGDNYCYLCDQVQHNDVTISFQTVNPCGGTSISVTQNGQTTVYFQFLQFGSTSQHENVNSVFNANMCHNGGKCQNVHYISFIHHFYIKLAVQGQFSYQIIEPTGSLAQAPLTFYASIPSKTVTGQQKFIFFGDLDTEILSFNTFKLLNNLITDTTIEAYIFLGDYAYEFYMNNGILGDQYLTQMQPFHSVKPWMFTPGNHEDNLNYTFYNDKFRSPNYQNSNNNYYSYDIGMVHFISLNFEFYNDGSMQQTPAVQQQMVNWLTNDLKQANLNRAVTPWIIGSGHKSIYCVSAECKTFSVMYAVFDQLFYQYGVDLFLGAHRHAYQFLKPMYNSTVYGCGRPDAYTINNPKATLYVIQGNGGNINMAWPDEGAQNMQFMLVTDPQTGLGRLTVISATQILLEYIQSGSQQVFDHQTITQTNHGPFGK